MGPGQRIARHRHVPRGDRRLGNWRAFRGAIILYETALGVGIALGPLIGGELGAISWRGPFYGVTVLMGIALVATIAFVQGTPRPARPTSILEPIRALRRRGLATMSVTALFYNWGFFTLLAYTPFLMHLGIHQLGYVFTCWGILVAIFAVFVATRPQRHFGTPKTLYVNLSLLAADLLVIALFPSSRTTLIVAVIVSGAFIGLNNTLTTQAVMLVSPVEKPIASASYGFVRFIGGGLAPYCASKLAIAFNVSLPFYVAAGSVVIGILVLATGHTLLTDAEKNPAEELVDPTSASEPTPLRRVTTIAPELVSSVGNIAPDGRSPIVAAIDSGPYAEEVTEIAIELALLFDCPVEVLHVIETDVFEELAVDLESHEAAMDVTSRNVSRVLAAGLAGGGHLLRVTSDHGEVGRRIAAFANEHHAEMIVIGTRTDTEIARVFDADLTDSLLREAHCAVHIVPSGSDDRPLRVDRRPQDDDLDREWIRFGRDLCSRCRAGQRTDQCFSTHGRRRRPGGRHPSAQPADPRGPSWRLAVRVCSHGCLVPAPSHCSASRPTFSSSSPS